MGSTERHQLYAPAGNCQARLITLGASVETLLHLIDWRLPPPQLSCARRVGLCSLAKGLPSSIPRPSYCATPGIPSDWHGSTHRYRARRAERDAALRTRLKELAAKRMRFGYRRLTAMLTREGIAANHKRVYRLYREEGLAMRIRHRRRIRCSL